MGERWPCWLRARRHTNRLVQSHSPSRSHLQSGPNQGMGNPSLHHCLITLVMVSIAEQLLSLPKCRNPIMSCLRSELGQYNQDSPACAPWFRAPGECVASSHGLGSSLTIANPAQCPLEHPYMQYAGQALCISPVHSARSVQDVALTEATPPQAEVVVPHRCGWTNPSADCSWMIRFVSGLVATSFLPHTKGATGMKSAASVSSHAVSHRVLQ